MKKTELYCLSGMAFALALNAGAIDATISNEGIKLSDSVPLSHFSRALVVEPPWNQKWFFSAVEEADFTKTDLGNGSYRVDFKQKKEPPYFRVNDFSALVAGDTATVTFDGELLKDLPTTTEYSMMMVPEELVNGASYTITNADGSVNKGNFSASVVENTNTSGYSLTAKEFEMQNRLGTLTVKLIDGTPFSIVDRRARGLGAEGGNHHPHYNGLWLGIFGEVKFGTPWRQVFEVTWTPKVKVDLTPAVSTPGSVAKQYDAAVVHDYVPGDDKILPTPKEMEFTAEAYKVTPMDRYRVNVAADTPEGARLKRAAARLLCDDYALPVAEVAGDGEATIQITVDPASDLNDEGYRLEVTNKGVTITAKTERGAFYGLQCLGELRSQDGFRGAKIVDYPTVGLRSMLMMVDNQSVEFHGKQIQEVLAPMRYNTIVVECEYVAWDATRDIHMPWAMSKADLRKLIEIANENFIEVVPLFQTLGHSEWLFKFGKNLDLADDVNRPYAYNVSNPRLYPLMKNVLDEVFDVFQPKYLHIGHDEVALDREFPVRPENKAIGGQKIFLDDVMFYYNYAKERGAKIMLWQDMFQITPDHDLQNGGSSFDLHKVIDKELPKDVVICFWDYEPNVAKNNFRNMKKMGFPLIGCTWNNEDNIADFTNLVVEENEMGMMATTWAGYQTSYSIYENEFPQAASYLKAGSWAWNPGREQNYYSAGKRLYDILNPYARPNDGAGFKLDLSPAANLVVDAEKFPFLYADTLGMERLVNHSGSTGEIDFILPKRDGKLALVALKNQLNPEHPASVEGIPVNYIPNEIYFLHGLRRVSSGGVKRGTVVGEYVLDYADGSKVSVPIRYGLDIALPTEDYTLQMAPGTALEWRNGDRDYRLWAMTVKNPLPGREIKSVSIRNFDAWPLYLTAISVK